MDISTAQQPLRQSAVVWARGHSALIALALTCLGALLRLYRVDANGLRLDELWSIWMAERSIGDIVRVILLQRVDATPPGYYLFAHFLLLAGRDLLTIRLVSIIAGTLCVWFTFRLAAYLFDLRVATMSALLIAVAPLHIEYSQVARAYTLAALWTLLSLSFFVKVFFEIHPRRAHLIGFVITTTAALYTHYLTALIVGVEIALILWSWLRRRVSIAQLIAWSRSFSIMAIGLLPLAYSSLSRVAPGSGQGWLERPGFQAALKSIILFGTGDPSYGPTGPTPGRAISALTILSIGAVGIYVFLQSLRQTRAQQRIIVLVCMVILPLACAFAVSQIRPVYREKYFLFVMPPMAILMAWIILHVRTVLAAGVLTLLLAGSTGSALVVYYTAPAGEQWREALAEVRSASQQGDAIVISPGFYTRPVAYYLYGEFPPELLPLEPIRTFARIPAVVVQHETFRAMQFADPDEQADPAGLSPASAERIWVVSGYSPPEPVLIAWLDRRFMLLKTYEFQGACVQLFQRVNDNSNISLQEPSNAG